ncbi:hypothetical protein BGW80DRAFT_1557043 [Lactifluus volemus]|nr:hypothetical protein BGW80DRAFT_1557043 [Lactifluus volemus]
MSNYSPTREPQGSVSLFPAPNREPLENPGNIQPSPISTLNDDTLLNIFYLYRLHCLYIRDEDEDTPLGFIRMWKPAQVSRRWRDIILASPCLLDLRLVCTFRVHVADMLSQYPHFPIAIFYNENLHEMTKNDEEGALFALSHSDHRDRVYRISLTMPHHKLEKFTVAMSGQFPTLERLDIGSSTPEGSKLILPQSFDAPNLRHLDIRRIELSIQSPLLKIARGIRLVFLRLEDVPRFAYFLPSYILTQLSSMPQLETLMIVSHNSPLPNHEVVDTPTMAHVTLPNLRVFSFRGFGAYLEDLLSRMNAPALSIFHVQYFYQPTFSVPHLLPFMQTSENFGFHAVRLNFNCDSFHLESESDARLGKLKHVLESQTTCRLFQQWQVGSVAAGVQILSTLSPIFSVVERVEFIMNRDELDSGGWYDHNNRTGWREIFRPFKNVKALRMEVDPKLMECIGYFLWTGDGEQPLELLPNLEELSYSRSYVVHAFTTFINDRQAIGHPVRLVRNSDGSQSKTRITHTLAMRSSSDASQQRLCCPMLECDATFKHSRDVKHHVVARHLPYAIFCPIPSCYWRGGCRDEYDVHYRIQHPEYDKHEPGQTYDNAATLRSIFEYGTTYEIAEGHALWDVSETALQFLRAFPHFGITSVEQIELDSMFITLTAQAPSSCGDPCCKAAIQSGEQQQQAQVQVAGSHFLPVLPVSVQVPRK